MHINWYPGHMTKARRDMQEKLKLVDVVIEVLDARAPKSTRNPDFDDLFAGKARMCILNKEDMADPRTTGQWLAFFRNEGIYAVSYSALKGDPRELLKEIEKVGEPIYEKYRQKGIRKTVRCLVCGIPNVGKSAILNRLAGKRKLKEGNKPGLTRGFSWVKLTPYMEFMDSPGLLWPKIEDPEAGAAIALLGCIRQEVLDAEEMAWYLVKMLSAGSPALLKERYDLPDLPQGTQNILEEIFKKRGFLLKGGNIDFDRGYAMLLEEFKNGKMGRFSLESPPCTEC